MRCKRSRGECRLDSPDGCSRVATVDDGVPQAAWRGRGVRAENVREGH